MNREITIGKRTLPVAFNMATLLAFEDITGRPFFGEDFQKTKERLAIIFAAVYAANKDTDFSVEDLMDCEDWQQVSTAFETVTQMASEFFTLPKVVAEAEQQEAAQQNDGDDAKN